MHSTLFQILAVLHEFGPTDASSALARMEGIVPAGELPSLPAFYRHLRRAMECGWVAVDGTEEVDDDRGGRPARLYKLTSEGRRSMRARALELEAITRLALQGRGG